MDQKSHLKFIWGMYNKIGKVFQISESLKLNMLKSIVIITTSDLPNKPSVRHRRPPYCPSQKAVGSALLFSIPLPLHLIDSTSKMPLTSTHFGQVGEASLAELLQMVTAPADCTDILQPAGCSPCRDAAACCWRAGTPGAGPVERSVRCGVDSFNYFKCLSKRHDMAIPLPNQL